MIGVDLEDPTPGGFGFPVAPGDAQDPAQPRQRGPIVGGKFQRPSVVEFGFTVVFLFIEDVRQVEVDGRRARCHAGKVAETVDGLVGAPEGLEGGGQMEADLYVVGNKGPGAAHIVNSARRVARLQANHAEQVEGVGIVWAFPEESFVEGLRFLKAAA